jgi:hypothetical protein
LTRRKLSDEHPNVKFLSSQTTGRGRTQPRSLDEARLVRYTRRDRRRQSPSRDRPAIDKRGRLGHERNRGFAIGEVGIVAAVEVANFLNRGVAAILAA